MPANKEAPKNHLQNTGCEPLLPLDAPNHQKDKKYEHDTRAIFF